MKRYYLAGCPVDAGTLDDMTARLCDAVKQGAPCQVFGVNAAFVVDAYRSAEYRQLLEAATHVPADGFWVALAARVLGYAGVAHVGVERLVYRLLRQLAPLHSRVFLLGAREDIVAAAAAHIETAYPGLQVVGWRNGYFSETDEPAILAAVNAARPDVVLLGMTSPKKEQWNHKYHSHVTAAVTIGVGGLFDVMAGKVPSAPDWVKDWGLEWFFRLSHDPRRLWRRYTVGNATFLWLVAREWLKQQQTLAVPR